MSLFPYISSSNSLLFKFSPFILFIDCASSGTKRTAMQIAEHSNIVTQITENLDHCWDEYTHHQDKKRREEFHRCDTRAGPSKCAHSMQSVPEGFFSYAHTHSKIFIHALDCLHSLSRDFYVILQRLADLTGRSLLPPCRPREEVCQPTVL